MKMIATAYRLRREVGHVEFDWDFNEPDEFGKKCHAAALEAFKAQGSKTELEPSDEEFTMTWVRKGK